MTNSMQKLNIAWISSDDNVLSVQFNSRTIEYNDGKKFIKDIPKLFKNFKAVLLNIFTFNAIGFKSNMDFCKAVKEKLNSLKIPHFFNSTKNFNASRLFVTANLEVKVQDIVVIIMAIDTETAVIYEYEFTENGYKGIKEKQISINEKENPKIIREKIFGTSDFAKMFLISRNCDCPLLKLLRKTLKSKNLIVFDEPPDTIDQKHLNELSKWIFDKTFVKYHILSSRARSYALYNQKNDKVFYKPEPFHSLPFETSIFVDKFNENIHLYDVQDDVIMQTFPLEQKCHSNKFTIKVDIENFIEVKHEKVIFYKILALPKVLDAKLDNDVPIIALCKDLSVICVRKNDGYQFLDEWNDLYGKKLAISFDEEKPKFCENAFQIILQKPTFIVFDIYKIMSMPIDDIKVEEYWNFKITKDKTHPILLEFDNFDGTRKLSTPAFLMAMLIRQHLKAIKNEIGEKPAEIGFCILDEFNEDEKKRIEKGLKESCELLKISCVFVSV